MKSDSTYKRLNNFLDKIDEIRDIDVNKECKKILTNPSLYFNPYIKDMDEWALILARIEIYLKLREVDRQGEKDNKSAMDIIEKISVSGYLDILKNFYKYSLETANFILNDSGNIMLDLYNAKKIDNTLLNKIMVCINAIRDMLIRDRQDLLNAIKDADDEQKKIDDENSGLPFDFLDTKF